MNKLFIITITALLMVVACKSKGGTLSDTSCTACEDAMVRFYGDPAKDGCGWVVEASSIIYMPKNLLPEFHEDSLKIRIKYDVLGRANCGLVKDAHPSMFIEEIYKQ